MLDKTVLIHQLGRIPFLGSALRWFARRYPEGSVVTIKNGHLAGYKWRRSHKYLTSYWLGTFELPIQNCLARELKLEDVFYDIGANAGFFSLLGSKCVGDKGHVFAFEPLPSNAEAVEEAFAINGLTNCYLIRAAVTNHSGEVSFSSSDDSSTAHITSVSRRVKTETFNVQALTLDEFTQKFPPPNLVKVDVEGAELLLLKGAEKLLKGGEPPKLIIEVHGEDNTDPLRDFLLDVGYRLFTVERESLTPGDPVPHHFLAIPHPEEMVRKAVEDIP